MTATWDGRPVVFTHCAAHNTHHTEKKQLQCEPVNICKKTSRIPLKKQIRNLLPRGSMSNYEGFQLQWVVNHQSDLERLDILRGSNLVLTDTAVCVRVCVCARTCVRVCVLTDMRCRKYPCCSDWSVAHREQLLGLSSKL